MPLDVKLFLVGVVVLVAVIWGGGDLRPPANLMAIYIIT
jgi:hypothetical protein